MSNTDNELNDRELRKQIAIKKASQRKTTLWIAIAALAIVVVTVSYVFFTIIQPQNKYNQALTALENEDLESAFIMFSELQDYEDSPEKVIEVKKQAYEKAKLAEADGYGPIAAKNYLIALGFSDSKDLCINISRSLSSSNVKEIMIKSIEYERFNGNISIWRELIDKYLPGSWKTIQHSYKSYSHQTATPRYTWIIDEKLRMEAEHTEKYHSNYMNFDDVTSISFDPQAMKREGYIIKQDINQKAKGITGDFSYIIHVEINVKEGSAKIYCNKSSYNLCNFTLEISKK